MDLSKSPQAFLQLKDEGLLRLYYNARMDEEELTPSSVDKLNSLTALTSLNLRWVTRLSSSLTLSPETFRQLLHLRLTGCPNMVSAFFVPGALQSLQTLHVLPDYGHSHPDEVEIDKVEMQKAADVILSLPHLRKVSGYCRVFDSEGIEAYLP